MEVDTYIAGQIAAGADPADEQFRLLVQSVTDYAIFLLDSGGRVISWNDGAERIKGYSAGEIVGQPIALFYRPEDRDAGKPEQGLRCAEREGRYRTEGWRVRKDGSRFWADVVITALRDARGGLRGFAKVTRDMTARQRERENEQRVAAMLERQRALAELGLLALGESGLEPVLERAVAVVRDLLQTEFVQVLELLPEGDALKLVAGTGWKPGMVGSATVPLGAALRRQRRRGAGARRAAPVRGVGALHRWRARQRRRQVPAAGCFRRGDRRRRRGDRHHGAQAHRAGAARAAHAARRSAEPGRPWLLGMGSGERPHHLVGRALPHLRRGARPLHALVRGLPRARAPR